MPRDVLRVFRHPILALERWPASLAVVMAYGLGHRHVFLALLPDEYERAKEYLKVTFVGCSEIHGPFQWPNARLVVARDEAEGRGIVVHDAAAGFRIHCGTVSTDKMRGDYWNDRSIVGK